MDIYEVDMARRKTRNLAKSRNLAKPRNATKPRSLALLALLLSRRRNTGEEGTFGHSPNIIKESQRIPQRGQMGIYEVDMTRRKSRNLAKPRVLAKSRNMTKSRNLRLIAFLLS